MILADFLVGFLVCGGIAWAGSLALRSLKSQQGPHAARVRRASELAEKALLSNDQRLIEDVLALYEDALEDPVKRHLAARRDDLIVGK